MKLKITIDQKVYEVEVEVVEPEAPAAKMYVASSRGPSVGGGTVVAGSNSDGRQPADEGKACRSPLAGVVSEIKVAEGDVVEADQPVLVLEAMKMFTTITSPVAGTIVAVDVEKGQAVKQGQLLLEVE